MHGVTPLADAVRRLDGSCGQRCAACRWGTRGSTRLSGQTLGVARTCNGTRGLAADVSYGARSNRMAKPPRITDSQFTCPHCGVFAEQMWFQATGQVGRWRPNLNHPPPNPHSNPVREPLDEYDFHLE